MKTAERIVMVVLLLVLIGGGYSIYFLVQKNHQEVVDAVANGEYEISLDTQEAIVSLEDWRSIYPNTVKIKIGETGVNASVADTLSKRMKGLSGTPFLPDNVVKLFTFGVEGNHSIWMKDMNYPIDIIWVEKAGSIVHIEENVSPDSYPDSFSSPTPSWYVIEAVAGFAASSTVQLGDQVVLITS